MCASSLPLPNVNHAVDLVNAALEIQEFMNAYKKERTEAGLVYFEIRIGIHSGPVISGVVGTKKFAFDIWGDTVNLAAHMEAGGVLGKVNISERTMELCNNYFTTTFWGKVDVKNKGEVKMYFAERLNAIF